MVRPRLRDEHGLHLEPFTTTVERGGDDLMTSRRAHRENSRLAGCARIAEETFELADLVSAVERRNQIVTLHPQTERRELLERCRIRAEYDALVGHASSAIPA